MYNVPKNYTQAYNPNMPVCNPYNMYQCPYYANLPMLAPDFWSQFPEQYLPCDEYPKVDTPVKLKDYGPHPFAIDIEKATKQNNNFRLALWTGNHLQLTLMSINVGDDIGLEMHPDVDQFIRIEEGQGLVKMGDKKENLDFQACVEDDFIFIVPAGKWHNLINTGNRAIKLYSIYAPPEHPHGTVHKTKKDAEEHHEHQEL
jgi:mannose-6-phosphate isomerase-like protein (cupin superfamily)